MRSQFFNIDDVAKCQACFVTMGSKLCFDMEAVEIKVELDCPMAVWIYIGVHAQNRSIHLFLLKLQHLQHIPGITEQWSAVHVFELYCLQSIH